MLLATTNDIPGKKYEIIGMVTGFGSERGKELDAIKLKLAQQAAQENMVNKAIELSADAIIDVNHIASVSSNQYATAVVVTMTGTAVKFV